MKKFLALTASIVLAAALAVGFSACKNCDDDAREKVRLVGLSSAADVVDRDDIDFFVVAEPAASARVKAARFNFAGNLQQLYGGDDGYPQAVIVAKNSLLQSDGAFVKEFIGAVERNADWLAAETTEISTIVTAVSSHLSSGTTPSLSAKNLTKSVISNCGIRYKTAADDKERVKSFLTELKDVQPSVKDNPKDEFFFNGVYGDGHTEGSVSVYAPDGAPALALAGLMSGGVTFENYGKTVNYNIVNATLIQNHVTGDAPAADICVLPVNLAANLLGSADGYAMLGTVTHGNLYILSEDDDEYITPFNINDLRGETVGVVNLSAVPGLTFKLILNKYNIPYVDPNEI